MWCSARSEPPGPCHGLLGPTTGLPFISSMLLLISQVSCIGGYLFCWLYICHLLVSLPLSLLTVQTKAALTSASCQCWESLQLNRRALAGVTRAEHLWHWARVCEDHAHLDLLVGQRFPAHLPTLPASAPTVFLTFPLSQTCPLRTVRKTSPHNARLPGSLIEHCVICVVTVAQNASWCLWPKWKNTEEITKDLQFCLSALFICVCSFH